jgi:hypothetical protein
MVSSRASAKRSAHGRASTVSESAPEPSFQPVSMAVQDSSRGAASMASFGPRSRRPLWCVTLIRNTLSSGDVTRTVNMCPRKVAPRSSSGRLET